MRIMLIVPRYHTNQTEWIKGLIKNNNQVRVLAQYRGLTESYESIDPLLIRESWISTIISKIIENSNYTDNAKTIKKMSTFSPSIFILFKIIRDYNPEVVILRDRTKLSAYSYLICKILKIECILYNQIPYLKATDKSYIKRILNRLLFPNFRMTPVIGEAKMQEKSKHEFFIPFAVKTSKQANRNYFKNNRINILSIGKFYERKNHLMLINVVNNLKNNADVHLTIVGEVSNQSNENYLAKVNSLISDLNLNSIITIKTNIPHEKMHDVFMDNDIYVLTSTKEQAAVSHLEAMAHGLPAICSDNNGTSSYIIDGVTGYIFKDNDEQDLYRKLYNLCKSKETIIKFGSNAYKHVINNYTDDQVYNKFSEMFKVVIRKD